MDEKNKSTNNARYKKNGGITLIALVITIIVMLILAAISINIALNGGLFEYAGKAGKEYNVSQIQEELQAGIYGVQMEYYKNGEEGNLIDYIFSEAEGKGQALLKAELGEDNLEFNKDDLEIGYKGVFFEIKENGEVKQVVHHEWIETAHVEATCTQDGYVEETCSICGETRRTVETALGHDWNTSTNKCKRCGEAYGWIVPEGGTYKKGSTIYNSGDTITEFPAKYDIFTMGDYEYQYNAWYSGNSWNQAYNQSGWGVRVLDKTRTSYGEILPVINEKTIVCMSYTFYNCTALITAPIIPNDVTNLKDTFNGCTSLTSAPEIPNGVKNMFNTFGGCTNLITAPKIPSGVTDMGCTFNGCTSLTSAPEIPNGVTNMERTFGSCTTLTTAPEIPNSVTNMNRTFSDCTSLIVAPAIPDSVTNMNSTFSGCTSLTGTITINANPTNYSVCFYNCAKDESHSITLTGSSTKLNELKATGYNSGQYITVEQ